jgi:hypothetical protein
MLLDTTDSLNFSDRDGHIMVTNIAARHLLQACDALSRSIDLGTDGFPERLYGDWPARGRA